MERMNAYDPILRNLWLGGYKSAQDKSFLDAKNIKLIVNCTKECPKTEYPNIKCVQLKVDDDPSSTETMVTYYPALAALIHESLLARRAVYVHCFAGMNRSPTLIAVYLMLYLGFMPADAVKYVREKRNGTFAVDYLFDVMMAIYVKHRYV